MTGPAVRVDELLDGAAALLAEGRVPDGMNRLAEGLGELRGTLPEDEWERLCRSALDHPIARALWQDPFTLHSFRKPRGYAGDAQLLDYIYNIADPPPGTTPLGGEVFHYMMGCLGARSVRSRAQILARIIDETAAAVSAPRILSVACGHLREAGHSAAVREGRVGEFVALDQDPESLAEVTRSVGPYGIRTVQNSVRTLLTERTDFRDFHLVYAAGLYDYLSERVAARLTRVLFDMVAPGGRVVVANFAAPLPESGYMESFMGWKLIYRGSEEMNMLSSEVPSGHWKSHRLFWDEHESVLFLDMVKRTSLRPVMVVQRRNGYAVPGMRNVKLTRGLVRSGRPDASRPGAEPTNGRPPSDGQ